MEGNKENNIKTLALIFNKKEFVQIRQPILFHTTSMSWDCSFNYWKIKFYWSISLVYITNFRYSVFPHMLDSKSELQKFVSVLLVYHRKVRLIGGNAKCCHLKNWPVKGLCGRCLFVWSPERHTPLHTVHYTCIQYTYSHREGGGESWTREKVRGATTMTACISTLETLINTCRTVPLQVNFFRLRHFALLSL